MREELNKKEISLTTPPYRPQSNRLAERMNYILAENARAILNHSSINHSCRCEVVR